MAVGGKRFYFLTSILKERYDFHVVALRQDSYSPKDMSLPVAVPVHQVPAFPVFPRKNRPRTFFSVLLWYLWIHFFSVFDPFVGWLIPGFIRGIKLIQQHNIDMIIATGPPFCAMVIAWLLGKVSKKPFILDYRDPWAGYAKGRDVKPFGKLINTWLERRAVGDAGAIVVVTPTMKELLRGAIPEARGANIQVITNGFHEIDSSTPLRLEHDRSVILYAGTFYGQRRIGLLIEPLQQLIKHGEISGAALRVHIFGQLLPVDRATIAVAGLTEQVIEHPFVEYATLIRYMKGADLLFLPSGTDVPYAIPGKFYDYLSVQRPILALGVPGSALESIVHETNCGEFVAIDDPAAIAAAIKKILTGGASYNFAGASNYTWNKIAEQYDGVIQSVLEHRFCVS